MGLITTRVFTTAHGDGGPDDEPAPDGGVGYYFVRRGEGGTLLPYDSQDPGFTALNTALEKLREEGQQCKPGTSVG